MSFEFNKMKAPGDKRPTWMGGIIQIHITRACNLSCTHCTQGSNFGGRPVMMSLENFEIAVKSLRDYPGVVGVFGGNPTMHPKFPEMCEILSKYIGPEHRGLWSNNLMGHGALCRATFNPSVSNLNVHCDMAALEEMKRDWPECNPIGRYDSGHSPVYVSMNDIKELTYQDKVDLINNCDINQLWSSIICQTPHGLRAFFCEIAGAQAMLMQDGYHDTGLPISDNWWKLPITAFEDQIRSHCFNCGVPLKGKGDLAVTGTKEYVSKTYLPIAKLKQKNKEMVVIDSLTQLGDRVNRATDYINNGLEPTKPSMGVWFPSY
jgi:hypothetical protein